MTGIVRAAIATCCAGAAVTAGAYRLNTTTPESGILGPGTVRVVLDVGYSRFTPDHLVVRQGTLVRFVVRNHDPIRHELIVGPREVHARHATGHEATHPPVPGEVSVEPNAVAETFYTFDQTGSVVFACHLPGHFEYGMHGEVEVRPPAR
jgi:uncharacterized cupredoxin-like copper-binding protein